MRRFELQLFIVHKTIDPKQITAALGLEPKKGHSSADSSRHDNRWRFGIRYETEEQYFASRVNEFVDLLAPRRDFLRSVSATGGSASLIVCFLGDGYFGDELSTDALTKIADLGLSLGLEIFQVPQA